MPPMHVLQRVLLIVLVVAAIVRVLTLVAG
jgi:hypothetical protein